MLRTTAGVAALLIAAPMFAASGVVTGVNVAHAQEEDCGDPPEMATMSFHQPQVIDDVRAGGEPSIEGLPDGTLLYAAHASTTLFKRDNMPDPDYVTPYTGATYVWRSTDGGDSWQYVGLGGTEAGPHATVSGFSDPDFAVDTAGNVYTSGINLANVYVAKSQDSGATWAGHPFATVITDREWLAADEEDVVYLNGNQTGAGRQLWKSTDGGLTFDLTDPVSLPGSGPPSKIYVDHSDGRLFFPDGAGGIAIFPGARTNDFTRVDAKIDAGTPHAHGFLSDMAIDAAGNVYVVSNTRNEIRVSHSIDRGESWSTTVIHDTTADGTPGVAEEVLWPWISAGTDGRVGVSWLQADRPVSNSEATSADYRVYAAQTLTGHGWVDECEGEHGPIYEVAVATPEPFHTGTICSSGTTCQIGGIDRRLGDYHTNSLTADGEFVIAYSDTSIKPDGAISHPGFVKQAAGVNFAAENLVLSEPPEPPTPAGDQEDVVAQGKEIAPEEDTQHADPESRPTLTRSSSVAALNDAYDYYLDRHELYEPATKGTVSAKPDAAAFHMRGLKSSSMGREPLVILVVWNGVFATVALFVLLAVAVRRVRSRSRP